MKNYKQNIVCFGNKTIVLQNVSQKKLSAVNQKRTHYCLFLHVLLNPHKSSEKYKILTIS